MKEVKLAIIGLGQMGTKYVKMLLKNSLGFHITAMTRIKDFRLEELKPYLKYDIKIYDDDTALFKAYDLKEIIFDAVLIATPHYNHIDEIKMALEREIFVLCDKPLGVKLSDALELLKYNTKLTAFIFQQREYQSHLKIKEILDSKIYGLPKRFSYIVTDWFRPNSYYKSSSWRASYKTDGGGVIINQCPHNLDFIYDLFGMPNQLISFNHNGRYHNIEVEDESTIYFEWESGLNGIFVASTGEMPGINRLEITLDRAIIRLEKEKMTIISNLHEATYYNNLEYNGFIQPINKIDTITFEKENDSYLNILRNFYDFIINDKKQLADFDTAINNLYLINAIYLANFSNKVIKLVDIRSEEITKFIKKFDLEFNKRIK